MANKTNIEFADLTLNLQTGCTKVSPGCKFCYAERTHKRLRKIGVAEYSEEFSRVRVWPHRLEEFEKKKTKSSRIFPNSMSDTYHEDTPRWFLDGTFDMMERQSEHHWQIITKRSERQRDYINERYSHEPCPEHMWQLVTVENRDALKRLDHLREAHAMLCGAIFEPLIEDPGPALDLTGLRWVIVGGESGSGARPMEADWVRRIRDLCQKHDIPFFFKQWWGAQQRADKRAKRRALLDDVEWSQFPLPHPDPVRAALEAASGVQPAPSIVIPRPSGQLALPW